MAIICRDHRLLFIMTPRTACTAVGELLCDQMGGRYIPEKDILDDEGNYIVQQKHNNLQQLIDHDLLTEQEVERLVVFATVRNPFDSLVSLYKKKAGITHSFLEDSESYVHRMPGYVEDMMFCKEHSFDQWIKQHYCVSPLRRLFRRRKRSLFGKFVRGADEVMKFENLQEDFDRVLRRADIEEPLTIPMINVTSNRDAKYQQYYSRRSRKIVEYAFSNDLARFNYRF